VEQVETKVDVLAVVDALIALMHKGPIGVRGAHKARAAIAELIKAADDFMSGGDEFGEVWRAERLRAALARVGGGK
jgi:hypothetical protein